MTYEFGYLREAITVTAAGIAIEPLDRLKEATKEFDAWAGADSGWFYPDGAGQRFELPRTHVLSMHQGAGDAEFASFLVLTAGFLLGLRLTMAGEGHLLRTPLRRGTLVSFWPKKAEIARCLNSAVAFWGSNAPGTRRLMWGAIHWFLVAQSFESQHEKFAWSYTVLDNLHRVAWDVYPTYRDKFSQVRKKPQSAPHGERPCALHKQFDSPLPSSFADAISPTARLVGIRNALIHEARWSDAPLGYAVSQDGHEITGDLIYFCSQIILGILDIGCEFRRHANSWQRVGLDVFA